MELRADPDFAIPGFFSDFSAGFFCGLQPDDYQNAPQTRRGFIEIFETPWHFIHIGPQVPALPGLGFGIVGLVLLPNQSRQYQVRLHMPHRSPSNDEFWDIGIADSDMIWAGYIFDVNDRPPLGTWSLSILQDDRVLLTQYFEVVAPQDAPELNGLCTDLFF
jgi:hypothetical protein